MILEERQQIASFQPVDGYLARLEEEKNFTVQKLAAIYSLRLIEKLVGIPILMKECRQ